MSKETNEKGDGFIEVPVCNDCNKPHYGRKNVEERCVCDIAGNWHWGKIQKEIEDD